MLGYTFWKAHFGGDPSVVGRTLQVGAERHTIVGVLPPEADRFPAGGADVWTALTFPPVLISEPARIDRAVGDRPAARRCDDGGSQERDRRRLPRGWPLTYPDTNRDRAVRLDGLQDAMVGPVKPMMLLLALSVAMLLAVACANIANLLLAQAHARTLEFGIRGAVGASPRTPGPTAVDGKPRAVRRRRRDRRRARAAARAAGSSRAIPTRFRSRRTSRSTAACWRSPSPARSAPRFSPGFPRTRRLRDTQLGADLRGDARSGLTRGTAG